ncbi:MAG TPA: hypothetical protein VFR23_24835 [Jiangellaceae bacterium]|nr:hypothetical protein [Jiangellaceae bacterium]
MTKAKTKTKRRPKRHTLAEQLQPQVSRARLAWLPFNADILIEAHGRAGNRRMSGALARRVLKRIAMRPLMSPVSECVTFAELRVLCGATLALQHYGIGGVKAKQKRREAP